MTRFWMMHRILVLAIVATFLLPSAVMAQEATPSPTFPASFQEQPLKYGITLLYYRFIDAPGGWNLYGEIRNDSNVTISMPTLRIQFTDKEKNIYAGQDVWTIQPELAPGERGVFTGFMTDTEIALIDGYTILAIESCDSHGTTPSNLATVQYELDDSQLMMIGDDRLRGPIVLRNKGTSLGEQPILFAISRDDAGYVNFVSEYPINPTPVQPGGFVRDVVVVYVLGSHYNLLVTERASGGYTCE